MRRFCSWRGQPISTCQQALTLLSMSKFQTDDAGTGMACWSHSPCPLPGKACAAFVVGAGSLHVHAAALSSKHRRL